MTGRVVQLPIGFWNRADLLEIARQGFAALNCTDPSRLCERLADEAVQSPLLMQEFCRALCKMNEVTETLEVSRPLGAPQSWEEFFGQRASDTSKTAFDLLKRGPRQRTDRKVRRLKDGSELDIYGWCFARSRVRDL